MNIHTFSDQPEKPFHSSGYAEVAQGGQIGSTNTQTFGQRYKIDQNRSAVRKYRDSYVGQGALRDQGRSVVPLPARKPMAERSSRQRFNAASSSVQPIEPVAKPTFREPPTRGYNPFS